MKSRHELHVVAFYRFCKLAHNVSLGTHLRGVPVRVLRIPHGKSVVVLGNGASEARTCAFKQLYPLICVEFFCGEFGDQVLVAEFIDGTVGFLPMLSLGRIGLPVNFVGVPSHVLAYSVDGINTPMGVDSKLGVPQPLRGRQAPERIPVGLEASRVLHGINLFRGSAGD
jgi:hypothetical protein